MTDDPDVLNALRTELAAVRAHLASLQEGYDVIREWLGNLQPSVDVLYERTDDLPGGVAALEARVAGDTALSGPGAIDLKPFDAGLGGLVVGFRDRALVAAGEDVYRGFEDFFRGSETAIGARQRAYMPLLRDRAPVLDVGCGRGELLELLRDADVDASGIDLDRGMVTRCRAKDLRAEVADAVGFLEAAADETFGAIVLLQVIEHLPYPELVALLSAARRKLRPEGRLVMETMNPHCPQALKNFWIDPTHQHPLYPEVVTALCALAGFASGFIWHADGTGDPDRDRQQQLDYTVVAQTATA